MRVAEAHAILVGVDRLVALVVAQNLLVVSRDAEEEAELRVRLQLEHFVLLQTQISRDFVQLLFNRRCDVIQLLSQLCNKT